MSKESYELYELLVDAMLQAQELDKYTTKHMLVAVYTLLIRLALSEGISIDLMCAALKDSYAKVVALQGDC